MADAEFNYEGTVINIQCTENEIFEDILNKFSTKVGKKKEDLYFIYGGDMLKQNLTFKEHANENDKKRLKMSILVNNREDDEEDENESLKKSKYIICPECKECCKIKINDYKFELYDCKNKHKKENISIDDFEETQNYDESKIKCQICNNSNKSTAYNNVFYICFDCKKNLCPLCNSKHDKSHNIIDYDDKFYTCDLHYESYISYCDDCKKDICITCEMEHSGHKIISYGSILPNVKKIKEEAKNLNDKKEEIKNEIKDIIKKLNIIIDELDSYYGIYVDIVNSYDNKKRNYSLLHNINYINKSNETITKDINKIINEKNINYKFNELINLYNKIISSNDKVDQKEDKSDLLKENNKVIENEKNTKDLDEKNEIHKNIEDNKQEKKQENKEDKLNEISEKKKKDPFSYYKIIEINNELMAASEKAEDNYKDFNVSRLKKILSLKDNKRNSSGLFVLNDGRIIINKFFGNDYEFCCLDLKNNISFNIYLELFKRIDDLIQMDDGIIIVRNDDLVKLIELKQNNYEIIFSEKNYSSKKIFKLSNEKIIFQNWDDFCIYIYKNKKLTLGERKQIKSMKNAVKIIGDVCVLNENEIVINYKEYGFIGDNYYIAFIDIEKDKKNLSFSVKKEFKGHKWFCLLDNENLIVANDNKLYPIYLKNHSKKKEYKIENKDDIHSIQFLNGKQFLVAQRNYIYQFELLKDFKLNLIHSIELNNYVIDKYPKNKFIFKEGEYEDIIHIYGYIA